MRIYAPEVSALVIVLALFGSGAALADLQPNEIAVLANSKFPGSVELAQYYCRQRDVPLDHIISLEMPETEPIGRAKYEQIATRIRQAFEELPDSGNIRCVLTVRGVPLRVSPSSPTAGEKEISDKLKQEITANLEALNGVREKVRLLAGLSATPPETMSAAAPSQKRWMEIRVEVTRELNLAWREARDISDPKKKQEVGQELFKLEQDLFGLRAKLNRLQKGIRVGTEDSQSQELAKLEEQLDEADQHMFRLLRPSLTADDVAQAGQIARLTRGLLGLIDQQNLLITLINTKHEETQSSFDSELSLLLAGEYPLKGPAPNPLRLGANVPTLLKSSRILMVSRLDGPTDAIARGLIDKAIRTEAKGLTGWAYIDAGWTKAGKGGYRQTEKSLLTAAGLLRRYSGLAVRQERTRELFAPGSCPDAALYCGWYSLGKYVDAFTWADGAVGYHIASSEARSLRDPAFTGWAAAMLRDGITATMGPVGEPYVTAFPPPDEFFTLLMTGRYTLVECFYMTKKYNSWRMVLVGDPLYKPFVNNPRLTPQQAEQILKQKLPPPDQWTAPSPIQP